MSAVEIASFVAAFAIAATRIFAASKPLWDMVPGRLRPVLPAIALVLPIVAERAAGAKSSIDLIELAVLALAMVMPGLKSNRDKARDAGEQVSS